MSEPGKEAAMDCRTFDELFSEELDGAVSPDGKRAIQEHRSTCAPCAREAGLAEEIVAAERNRPLAKAPPLAALIGARLRQQREMIAFWKPALGLTLAGVVIVMLPQWARVEEMLLAIGDHAMLGWAWLVATVELLGTEATRGSAALRSAWATDGARLASWQTYLPFVAIAVVVLLIAARFPRLQWMREER